MAEENLRNLLIKENEKHLDKSRSLLSQGIRNLVLDRISSTRAVKYMESLLKFLKTKIQHL